MPNDRSNGFEQPSAPPRRSSELARLASSAQGAQHRASESTGLLRVGSSVPLTKKQVVGHLVTDIVPDLIYAAGVAVAAFILRGQDDLAVNGGSAASVALNTFIISRLIKGGFQVFAKKLEDDARHAEKTGNDRWFYASIVAGLVAIGAGVTGVAGMLDVNAPHIRAIATYIAPIATAIMAQVSPLLYEQHLKRARNPQGERGSCLGFLGNFVLGNTGSLAAVISVTYAAYNAINNRATSVGEFIAWVSFGLAANFAANIGNQLRILRNDKRERSPDIDIECGVSTPIRRLFSVSGWLRYVAIILAGAAMLGQEAAEEGSTAAMIAGVGTPIAFLLLQLSVTLEGLAQEDALRQQANSLHRLERGATSDQSPSSLKIFELNENGEIASILPRYRGASV